MQVFMRTSWLSVPCIRVENLAEKLTILPMIHAATSPQGSSPLAREGRVHFCSSQQPHQCNNVFLPPSMLPMSSSHFNKQRPTVFRITVPGNHQRKGKAIEAASAEPICKRPLAASEFRV